MIAYYTTFFKICKVSGVIGTHEDLIKIIKTSYLRNEDRANNNKKLSDKDSRFFEQPEKHLYNELSISLGMTFDETKEYIINKISDLIK